VKPLTVAELIERLKSLPQDKPVAIETIDPYFGFSITDETVIEYDAEESAVIIRY
jgi:hypothetical protein